MATSRRRAGRRQALDEDVVDEDPAALVRAVRRVAPPQELGALTEIRPRLDPAAGAAAGDHAIGRERLPRSRTSKGVRAQVAPPSRDVSRASRSVSSVSRNRSNARRAPDEGTSTGAVRVEVAPSRAPENHAVSPCRGRMPMAIARPCAHSRRAALLLPMSARVHAVGEEDGEGVRGEVDDDRRAGVTGVPCRAGARQGVHVPPLVELEPEPVVVTREGGVDVRDEVADALAAQDPLAVVDPAVEQRLRQHRQVAAVEKTPAWPATPPSDHAFSSCTSPHTIPRAGVAWYSVAAVRVRSAGLYPVSCMPRGAVIRSRTTSSRPLPVRRSTSTPRVMRLRSL